MDVPRRRCLGVVHIAVGIDPNRSHAPALFAEIAARASERSDRYRVVSANHQGQVSSLEGAMDHLGQVGAKSTDLGESAVIACFFPWRRKRNVSQIPSRDSFRGQLILEPCQPECRGTHAYTSAVRAVVDRNPN